MGKVCTKCHVEKQLAEFSKNAKRKDKLSCWCKACHAQYYADNKEELSKKQKVKYNNAMQDPQNREQHRLRNTIFRNKHRDAARAAVAAWKKKNRDLANTYQRNIRAQLLGADGKHCHQEVMDMVLRSDGICSYCGCQLEKYHVDHKIPLSRGGSNSLDNLAISCEKCNLQKGTKTADEFRIWRLTWAKF